MFGFKDLGHVTWIIYADFCSYYPFMSYMNFGFDLQNGLEDLRKWLTDDRRTDDKRLTDDGHTLSLPCEPNVSGGHKVNEALQR